MITHKLCPKCEGAMYLNSDKDLLCVICGKIIYLEIRRDYDSRTGKIRNRKKETTRTDMDGNNEVVSGGVWSGSTSNNSSKVVRQGNLFRRNR